MQIIVKKANPDPPYSLHDACISKVVLEGDTLRLVTQYGYVCTMEPCGQVNGDVEIGGVDLDSSYAYIMEYSDVLCGNCGHFTGRKMLLDEFLKVFPGATLEILDETYGYRQVKLSGFLNTFDRLLECFVELYYTGEFRYLLKE